MLLRVRALSSGSVLSRLLVEVVLDHPVLIFSFELYGSFTDPLNPIL